jgi:hypothetical protein
VRCSIQEPINLRFAEIPEIDFGGSYTAEIDAMALNVPGVLSFSAAEPGHIGAFHASGVVNLVLAKAAYFYFAGGHFHFSEKAVPSFGQDPSLKMALFLDLAQSRGDVVMCCGFESQGAVQLAGLTTSSSGDLNCSGGRFINRNNLAIFADEANIAGSVLFAPQALGPGSGSFFVDGSVSMYGTHIGHFFVVQNARFAGTSTDQHGLLAPGLSVGDFLTWQNVTMDKGAKLDLSGAQRAPF